jgi:hypothetical protein
MEVAPMPADNPAPERIQIKHRTTDAVLFECELPVECLSMPPYMKLGWVAKRAIADNADLTYADLAGANLTYANLTYADLDNADLADADLAGANLTYADLAGANLTYADLAGANLAGANLTYADLAGAKLARADLANAKLAGAYLARADLTYADLAGANLTYANLVGTVGIVGAGHDPRGYEFFAVKQDDGWKVKAGCRWFTFPEAEAHWKNNLDASARVNLLRTLVSLRD